MNQLSDNPKYEVFIENIKEYYDLYERGLKKEANKQINKFALEFQTILPKETQREFLYKLCYDVCDSGDMHKLKQRGNGRLPYSLDKLIWEYLREQCKLETIPQLRWTYELYSYNPFDRKFNSFEMLKKAFCHKDCDQKTIDLYFEHLISRLDWGAHHFPQGCIIKRSTYEKTLRECHEILAHRSISSHQISELMYFEKLYKCFYEYEESGDTKDFYKLCQDNGIDFESVSTFYYRK